ncbi:MAG TPA: hypothetical protein VGT00_01910 [Methylomirabilota bacterium]|jgi:hypothetical protein|nr:hypothetical protein [Methylomirabilota bacterium]
MKKRTGRSKAKAKPRPSPAARARKAASPGATGLRPIKGARRHEMGGVKIDSVAAANGQVKRVVYPPGFRWSTHMKPLIGTELCMHGHVGFLTSGRVEGKYGDGCVFEFAAPQVVVVEPGHDAWVVGREPAVLIQFDAAAETAQRFGLPAEHRHAG